MTSPVLILQALCQPESVSTLSLKEWDVLIRQGRRANLLARLTVELQRHDLLDQVPAAPRQHLQSALRMVERQDIALRWEITCLERELQEANTPFILLKGAAYVMAGLPAARGRTFSDVDIMVPKAAIGRVESELMLHGWQGTHHSTYDQRYYRRWMHELPPMRHIRRGTSIDVHHAILPETARIKVNTPELIKSAIPLPGRPNVCILQPTDMVLHSATHLFHEGHFDNGLRDLFDLDSLLRHFGDTPGFWSSLAPRAEVLGLSRPLFYALRYTTRLLHTPVPQSVLEAVAIRGKPSRYVLGLMDRCYEQAFRPHHSSCDMPVAPYARLALYVRSHWIRMPWPRLVAHLTRKALTPPKKPEKEDVPAFARESDDTP